MDDWMSIICTEDEEVVHYMHVISVNQFLKF